MFVRGKRLPAQCFGGTTMGADVHTNQFSVLDIEEGVDTHDDNQTLQVTTSADVESCGDVVCGCTCKDSKQL